MCAQLWSTHNSGHNRVWLTHSTSVSHSQHNAGRDCLSNTYSESPGIRGDRVSLCQYSSGKRQGKKNNLYGGQMVTGYWMSGCLSVCVSA